VLDRGTAHRRRSRTAPGREVDLLADDPLDPVLIEIKRTRSVTSDAVRSLDGVAQVLEKSEIAPRSVRRVLVSAGDDAGESKGIEHVPWHRVAEILAR
jgi:hypothetical protein